MQHLGCFIITFNRPDSLRGTIRRILEQTLPPEQILVVDNGDGNRTRQLVPELQLPEVEHYITGDNLGPAGAAGIGLSRMARRGYDWIYWVDDDDPPCTPDTLQILLRLARTSDQDIAAVAAVGHRFDWAQGTVARLADNELSGPIEIDVAGGGSQLIVAARAVRFVGVPDERLFFGIEEFEYCLRLRRAGHRILVDGNLMFEYRRATGRIGYQRKMTPYVDSPLDSLWRRHYGTRNYIYCMRVRYERPDLAHREAVRSVGRALYAWTRGPRYGAAFSRMQLRGVVDGYAGRMGRRVLPKPKY